MSENCLLIKIRTYNKFTLFLFVSIENVKRVEVRSFLFAQRTAWRENRNIKNWANTFGYKTVFEAIFIHKKIESFYIQILGRKLLSALKIRLKIYYFRPNANYSEFYLIFLFIYLKSILSFYLDLSLIFTTKISKITHHRLCNYSLLFSVFLQIRQKWVMYGARDHCGRWKVKITKKFGKLKTD